FFQAEDGIRDFHVTGVQTCALPIFRPATRSSSPSPARAGVPAPTPPPAPRIPPSAPARRPALPDHAPARRPTGAASRTGSARNQIGRASCRERVQVSDVAEGRRQTG